MNAILAPSLPTALSLARRVLRILIPVNLIFGALIFVLLIASLIAPRAVFTALGVDPMASYAMIAGMRAIMVIGIGAVACADRVLRPLEEIVETVRSGD